jgi:nucleoside-diphosphate-sugar epimerase
VRPSSVTKAIVTGGSGFIGSHLIQSLVDGGVTVINVDIARPSRPLDPRVVTLSLDIRRPLPDPPESVMGADLFVHLAAVAREPGFPDAAYEETNVVGTDHVLEWCSRIGVSRLWFASSMSAYGPSEEPLYETARLRPQTPYGRSKVDAERLVDRWLEADVGRRAIVVRPAVVFGPGERGNFTRLARALKRRRFAYPGRSDTIKASVHVDELIRSMWFLSSLQPERSSGPLVANIAYPDPSTIRDICDAFHAVGNLPRPLGTVPLPVVALGTRIVSRLKPAGDVAPLRVEKLVKSTNIYPGVLLEHGYSFETNLMEGLESWYQAEPHGEFV